MSDLYEDSPKPTITGVALSTGFYTPTLTPPLHAGDFEDLCFGLYHAEFAQPVHTVSFRGRNGQSQQGLDIEVHHSDWFMGVQCKHYPALTHFKAHKLEKTLRQWVKEADDGKLPITHLVLSLSCSADTRLNDFAKRITDERRKDGKFPVTIESWRELTARLGNYPHLQAKLVSPPQTDIGIDTSAPSGLPSQLDRSSAVITPKLIQSGGSTLPDRSSKTLHSVVGLALDRVKALIEEHRYSAAWDRLVELRPQLPALDAEDRYRWHANAGSCLFTSGDYVGAAKEFLDAFALEPSSPKAWANKVVALCLQKSFSEAAVVAQEAVDLFPNDGRVWATYVQARADAGLDLPKRSSLSDEIGDTADVLIAYAAAALQQDRLEDVIDLGRQALRLEPKGFGAQRLLLAGTLLIINRDPARSILGQLGTDKRALLTEAVDSLLPFKETLDLVKGTAFEMELAINVASALHILRRSSEAISIVEQHPGVLRDGLALPLAMRLYGDRLEVDQIKPFFTGDLGQLSVPALLSGLEMAMLSNDKAWALAVDTHLASRQLEEDELPLRAGVHLEYLTRFGQSDTLLEATSQAEDAFSESATALVCVACSYKHLGSIDAAIAAARKAAAIAVSHDHNGEIYQAASVLYLLESWADAIPLYEKLLIEPADNEITHNLIGCYLRCFDRASASKLFARMPAEAKIGEVFRTMEIHLRQQSRDWKALRVLFEGDIAKTLSDARWAINYAIALDQLEDQTALKDFLDKDPRLIDADIKVEFEFARLQVNKGTPLHGVRRLYRRVRCAPDSAAAASTYLFVAMLTQNEPLWSHYAVAVADSAVSLSNATGTRTVLLESSGFAGLPDSVDTVDLTSPFGHALLGRSVGDRVATATGGEETITVISSIYSYAASGAHEVLKRATEPAGPLWSVPVEADEDGVPNVQAVIATLTAKEEYGREILKLYSCGGLPVASVARMTGNDELSLWFGWPKHICPLIVCLGSNEDRQGGIDAALIESPVVIDLLTMAELVQHDLEALIPEMLGRPLISQSAVHSLNSMIQVATLDQGRGVMTAQNGKLTITEYPDGFHEGRRLFLSSVKKAIETHCEIVPVLGPDRVPDPFVARCELLTDSERDFFLLALERGARIVTEDAVLAAIGKGFSIEHRIWIQPLLMVAIQRELLDRTRYAKVLGKKMAVGQTFISMGPYDFFALLGSDPTCLSTDVLQALRYCSNPSIDIKSAAVAISGFLYLALRPDRLSSKAASSCVTACTLALLGISGDGAHYLMPAVLAGALGERIIDQSELPAVPSRTILSVQGIFGGYQLTEFAAAVLNFGGTLDNFVFFAAMANAMWDALSESTEMKPAPR